MGYAYPMNAEELTQVANQVKDVLQDALDGQENPKLEDYVVIIHNRGTLGRLFRKMWKGDDNRFVITVLKRAPGGDGLT